MKVEKVEIILHGKFQLSKLIEMGYKQIGLQHYVFDGRMHHYDFIKGDNQQVIITITKRHREDRGLDHRVTFPQIDSWVKDSVNAIAGEKNFQQFSEASK